MLGLDPRSLNSPSFGFPVCKSRWLERNHPKGSGSLGNRGAERQKGLSTSRGAALRAPHGGGPAPPRPAPPGRS